MYVGRERESLGSWGSLEQLYLYFNCKLENFQVLASRADAYSSLERQTSLNWLQMSEVIECSLPPDFHIILEALHSSL